MEVLKTIVTVLQVLASLFLIVVVLLQNSKEGLSGAISGSSDSYLSKNKSGNREARLSLMTKWVGALFLIATLALCML